MRDLSHSSSERGMALLMSLLVLLILSIVAASMMVSLTGQTQMTGSDVRASKALNLAEAGTAEALARIRSRDVPDTLNPRMVTQIFLAAPGSVPVVGTDTTALATQQPSGSWLKYSTTAKDPAALTVKFKTDANRTVIYRYDPSRYPSVQTSSGMPVYEITSTGRVGREKRTIVSEVVSKPFTPAILAAVSVRAASTQLWCGAKTHGPFIYNGNNHRADTPTGAGMYGPDPENYVGTGDLPSFWTTATIKYGGNRSTVCCYPAPAAILENQPPASFYAGPWEALSLTQAEFYQLLGTRKTTVPASLRGVTYLDNNAIARDATGRWTINNGNGEGLLYVDGDLTVSGDFYWRGLIFVEGEFDISGNIWVLGGVVVNDPNSFACKHVRATFLYSKDAISQTIVGSTDYYTLSWREVH